MKQSGTENFLAVIVAAGSGQRLGCSQPKAFVELAGQTILERALKPFIAAERFIRIVVVVPEAQLRQLQSLAGENQQIDFVIGGSSRQESVQKGLSHLLRLEQLVDAKKQKNYYVVVHDAARCLLALSDLERILEAVRECQAISLGLPLADTVKRATPDGQVIETLKRSELWAVQTPPAFRLDLLVDAHLSQTAAGFTDDAAMVEQLHPVYMLQGRADNFKITTEADLRRAEFCLSQTA